MVRRRYDDDCASLRDSVLGLAIAALAPCYATRLGTPAIRVFTVFGDEKG